MLLLFYEHAVVTRGTNEVAQCEDDQFQCKDGECIPGQFHGDNVTDCRDGSDEATSQHGGSSNPNGQNLVDCSPLTSPDHGHVTVTGRLATFSCDDGYNLSSSTSQLQCNPTGAWVGDAPTCQSTAPPACVESDGARCAQFLSGGIACSTILLMPNMDCHCSCVACGALPIYLSNLSCKKFASRRTSKRLLKSVAAIDVVPNIITQACQDTEVDSLPNPCDDPCIQAVISQVRPPLFIHWPLIAIHRHRLVSFPVTVSPE